MIEAYPDRYIKDGGPAVFTPAGRDGRIEAIQVSDPNGEEIRNFGHWSGGQIAGSPGKGVSAHRAAPFNVRLIGQGATDPNTSIRSMFFSDQGGGIHKFMFIDQNMRAAATQYPFVGVDNPKHSAKIGTKRCQFTAPGGKVLSFLRTYGHVVHCEDTTFIGAKEYGWYFNPGRGPEGTRQGKNVFRGVKCSDLGRGPLQCANRYLEAGTHVQNNYVPGDDEELLIEHVTARACGWDGSSHFSIAGFPGAILIRNLDIDTPHGTGLAYIIFNLKQTEQEPGVSTKYGRAIAPGKMRPDLRAANQVTLDLRGSLVRMLSTDREPLFIDSCERLTIASDEDTVVEAPRALLTVERDGAGKVKCPAGFPLAGQPVADRSVNELVMAGTYEGWTRTGNYKTYERFLRNGAQFQPDEYYSPRGE